MVPLALEEWWNRYLARRQVYRAMRKTIRAKRLLARARSHLLVTKENLTFEDAKRLEEVDAHLRDLERDMSHRIDEFVHVAHVYRYGEPEPWD